MKCHDGKTRKLTGGDYGWCINRDKTTEELIPLLESGAEKKIEPVYLYSAVPCQGRHWRYLRGDQHQQADPVVL